MLPWMLSTMTTRGHSNSYPKERVQSLTIITNMAAPEEFAVMHNLRTTQNGTRNNSEVRGHKYTFTMQKLTRNGFTILGASAEAVTTSNFPSPPSDSHLIPLKSPPNCSVTTACVYANKKNIYIFKMYHQVYSPQRLQKVPAIFLLCCQHDSCAVGLYCP